MDKAAFKTDFEDRVGFQQMELHSIDELINSYMGVIDIRENGKESVAWAEY